MIIDESLWRKKVKILALDSSALVASVALIEDDKLIAEYTTQYKKTHSQTLLPMLDEIKKMVELDLNTIDTIAISAGPGSFTGLRIGAATVKGMANALDIPVTPVSTLKGMAYQIYDTDAYICPIMDARRSQVYTCIYKWDENGKLINLIEECAISIEEIISIANEMSKKVIFLGDGVPIFKDMIVDKVGENARFAPAFASRQRAAVIAVLAGELYQDGKFVSADEFAPVYLRMSQAERERLSNDK